MEQDPPLSAEVVLKPRHGDALSGPITAATLERHRPDPQATAAVQEHFRSLGFTVGEVAGISCTITAPRTRFRQAFGVPLHLDRDENGHLTHVTVDDGGRELPLDRLPHAIAEHIAAVTFTPPPDFGPIGWL